MGKCKTKAIQTDLGTFRDNQAYPGIIQAYSKPCVTLVYLEPLAYLQLITFLVYGNSTPKSHKQY